MDFGGIGEENKGYYRSIIIILPIIIYFCSTQNRTPLHRTFLKKTLIIINKNLKPQKKNPSKKVKNCQMHQQSHIQLKNTRYFHLMNQMYKYSLYVASMSQKFSKEEIYLVQHNPQSLGQIWQITCVNPTGIFKDDCYQIVHTRSTLVLTKMEKSSQVRLAPGQWLDTQLFYIERVGQKQGNIYRFVRASNKSQYLHYDKMLKIAPISPNDIKCHWLVIPSLSNKIIHRGCYFQNTFSSLVIDVPGASLKQGCRLIQYQFNNRFNQRFNIWTEGRYYQIANCNSKLLLTISKRCQEGDDIVQKAMDKSKEQDWILEYQGRNIYLIRSVLNPEMMIGINERSMKQVTGIISTRKQEYAGWKIVGYVPKRK